MPRVKRGTHHIKRLKPFRKATKGFKWGRKSKIKLMKVAVVKAGAHAYVDRRTKKRLNRGLWQIRINAAVREQGTTYSKFISALKKKGIALDRKVLSELAIQHPEMFDKLVASVKF